MAFSADDINKAREGLKRRRARRTADCLALHERACKDFESIVKMIIERFNPEKIYQWGSLLRPERFREYSDIDIAVEGIVLPEVFFDMLGKAQAMTEFSVDMVQIEKIEPEFAGSIRTQGRIVYERKD